MRADSNGGFLVRIPDIDDLVLLKEVLAELRPDQALQLEYLKTKREMDASQGRGHTI